jgi:hypothetical protein
MRKDNLDAKASSKTSTPIGWYKWYSRDFWASMTVRSMSPIARSIYRDLLDVQFEHGCLPPKERFMRALGWSETDWQEFEPYLEECFPNGMNPKMDEIRQQAIEDREKQIRAGKKSGEARSSMGKSEPKTNTRSTDVQRTFNGCSTDVQQVLNQTETETETETETIKDKKDAIAPSSRKGKVDFLSLAKDAGFEDDMFLKAWSEFVEHRREIKHPMSERAANLILAKLKKFSIEVGVEAINRSISSGWRDVFPEKASQRVGAKGRPSRMGSALEYMASNRDNVQEPEYFNAEFKEIILKRQKALEGK